MEVEDPDDPVARQRGVDERLAAREAEVAAHVHAYEVMEIAYTKK